MNTKAVTEEDSRYFIKDMLRTDHSRIKTYAANLKISCNFFFKDKNIISSTAKTIATFSKIKHTHNKQLVSY